MPRTRRLSALVVLAVAVLAASSSAPADAASGKDVLARIPIGHPVPGPIFDGAFGFGALWASVGDDVIARVDPATNEITDLITVDPGFRHEIGVGADALWVTNPDSGTISRINPVTALVSGTFSTGGDDPVGVATTVGAVWVSNHHADETGRGSVVRLDPGTGSIITTIPLGAEAFAGGPGGMTASGDSVWVGVPNMGMMARIDASTNSVAALIPVAQPCGIPALAGSWLVIPGAGCGTPYLGRIDPSTGSVGKLSPGGIARFAAGEAGAVWATVTSASCPPKCPPSSAALARIDAATGEVVSRTPLDGSGFVATGAGSIWVGVGEAGEILRLQP